MKDSRPLKPSMLIFRRKSMATPHSESRSTLANTFHLIAAAVKTLNLTLAIQHLIMLVISVARSTSSATAHTSSLLRRLSKNKSETSQFINPLLDLASLMLLSSTPARRSNSTDHYPHLTRNPSLRPSPLKPKPKLKPKPLIQILSLAIMMKKRLSFCLRNLSVRLYPPPGRLIQAPPHTCLTNANSLEN